jgi:hypothetical protein|tara:strand:+ start:242 stop:448 length:207 start_codon:yes stop_codon:yes gene_type:complete
MSITKELDRISFDVFMEVKTNMYETIAKELEYSDLEDIDGDNDCHEYIMDSVINRFIQVIAISKIRNN